MCAIMGRERADTRIGPYAYTVSSPFYCEEPVRTTPVLRNPRPERGGAKSKDLILGARSEEIASLRSQQYGVEYLLLLSCVRGEVILDYVNLSIPSALLRINSATKNLVLGRKKDSAQRMRCFASFSMTLKGGHPAHGDGTRLHRWSPHERHHGDPSPHRRRLSLARCLNLLHPFDEKLRSHSRFNPLENNVFDSILNRFNVVIQIDPQ